MRRGSDHLYSVKSNYKIPLKLMQDVEKLSDGGG